MTQRPESRIVMSARALELMFGPHALVAVESGAAELEQIVPGWFRFVKRETGHGIAAADVTIRVRDAETLEVIWEEPGA